MTKKKYDVSEWISARHSAHILTLSLGRKVRPDTIHRIATRLHLPIHQIDVKHWLYLKSAIQSITERDFPSRKKRL